MSGRKGLTSSYKDSRISQRGVFWPHFIPLFDPDTLFLTPVCAQTHTYTCTQLHLSFLSLSAYLGSFSATVLTGQRSFSSVVYHLHLPLSGSSSLISSQVACEGFPFSYPPLDIYYLLSPGQAKALSGSL